jgi:hypothetical protein
MVMEDDPNCLCPLCGKPMTDVDCIYHCYNCNEVFEIFKDDEIWTMIKAPVGKIEVKK